MIQHRAHVYRLYPTAKQASLLGQWIGAVRSVYNLALEQRRYWYKPGRAFDYAQQCRELTALRAEIDWMKAAPIHPLQQALRDLASAYKNWWAKRAGAPTPRKRGLNDSMRFPDPKQFEVRRLSTRWGEVRLPKLGWARFRWTRGLPGKLLSITVSRRSGQWFISVAGERDIAEPSASLLPAVGIDMGITVFAALSDGKLITPLNAGRSASRTLARAQRKLARKKRGSANRRKAKARVARLHARITASRNDFLHKASTAIAKNHGYVVVENLKVSAMSSSARGTATEPGKHVRQKSGLNRSILDQGWGAFRTMLAYKLAARGGQLVAVSPRNTSRTCEACGHISADSRSGIRFVCVACGHSSHADLQAARNILKRGQDMALLPVEASGNRAVEAGTAKWAA